MSMRLTILLFALLGTAPLEPILPGTEHTDALGYREVVAVRVLGLRDGRLTPVAGAVVSAWSEEVGPDRLAAVKMGEGRSDALGIANVRWGESEFPPFHWVVEADGWAVWHDAGIGAEVVLVPAVTHLFGVLDPLGRPLPGALVEAFHGCPHAPALRSASTDGDGLVALPGLAADPAVELWIAAPGVAPGPYDVPRPAIWDPDGIPFLLTDPGRTLSGIVLDAAEKPLRDVIVREDGYPRGPATTTGADGRFVLHGIGEGAAVRFWLAGLPFGDRPALSLEAFVEDVPVRAVLRSDRPSELAEDEPICLIEVMVRCPDIEEDEGLVDDVPVSLVRLADGFTVRGETGSGDTGLFSADVPAGEYRIDAGGGFSAVAAGRATVRVPIAGEAPVALVLRAQPTLVVSGPGPGDEEIQIRVHGAETVAPRDALPPIPATGPAVVLAGGGGLAIVPVGPLEGGSRAARIPPAALTRVRIVVRTADGGAAPGAIDVEWDAGEEEFAPADDGSHVSDTIRRGWAVVLVSASGYQDERRVVDLPREAGKVDAGEVVLRRTALRTFRVLGADGTPLTDVEPERAPADGWGNEILDEDGRFTVEVGPRPEPWVVATPSRFTPRPADAPATRYPLRVDLDLESPTDIRFPAGRITVVVRDADGAPIDAVVWLDLLRIAGEDGVHEIRGVPAGGFGLIVGARDHVGETRRVDLAEGERRRVEVTLRHRR